MKKRYAAMGFLGILSFAIAVFFGRSGSYSVLAYRPLWILLGAGLLGGSAFGFWMDRSSTVALDRASHILDCIREMARKGWPGAIVCEDGDRWLMISGPKLGESLELSPEAEILSSWSPLEYAETMAMLKKSLFAERAGEDERAPRLLASRFVPAGAEGVVLAEEPEGYIFYMIYGDDNEEK